MFHSLANCLLHLSPLTTETTCLTCSLAELPAPAFASPRPVLACPRPALHSPPTAFDASCSTPTLLKSLLPTSLRVLALCNMPVHLHSGPANNMDLLCNPPSWNDQMRLWQPESPKVRQRLSLLVELSLLGLKLLLSLLETGVCVSELHDSAHQLFAPLDFRVVEGLLCRQLCACEDLNGECENLAALMFVCGACARLRQVG